MQNYVNKKRCLIYPENPRKSTWDLFITLVLLVSCFSTPYIIAFSDAKSNNLSEKILEITIDILFLIDIIIIFNTAFYTEGFALVDNRSDIAIAYMSGWFTIDILAIIPFDYFQD